MKNISFKVWKLKIITLSCIILIILGLGYLYYIGILRIEVPRAKKDIIGIIKIEGPILSSYTTYQYIDTINYAITNKSVKAIVLIVDSPGGYVDLIEQIYLDLLKLKKNKPLIASIVSALSGGYYISVAADYIYVLPTSMVGNIGVIGIGPSILIPSEQVIETGIHKVTGFSQILFPYNLSHALDNFVSAVEEGRGDRLKLSLAQLKRGTIFIGSEAIKVGLVDEIGSLQEAISKAAKEANLIEYDVVELTKKFIYYPFWSERNSNQILNNWENLTIETLNEFHPPPAIYYLYLPPNIFTKSLSSTESQMKNINENFFAGGNGENIVLVDVSHGNKISWWELDILIEELVKRNITVRFVSQWNELNSTLNNASALIVASPTKLYNINESKRIENFVHNGGMLLLFFDPAYEYIDIQTLLEPINSLSTQFGLTFAKGYLYNENEYYGIYRNIYVKNFAKCSLTQNLTSLIFFTATHIYSLNKGIAWTSKETYSSIAERADNYTVIALVKENGTVVAFGDLTFLREPYCYLEDNYKLIQNLASIIAKAKRSLS
jgi:ClpP class serine protease